MRNPEETPLPKGMAEALAELASGGVVGLPTDTVYGLAGLASRPDAVARIMVLKGRPPTLPLPVLVSGVEQARTLVRIGSAALTLMEAFWPGGLTIVLPAIDTEALSPGLGLGRDAGGRTVGVRYPHHPVPVALCMAVGPLATTSANLHGAPTPATAAGVATLFGQELPVVIDGGSCDAIASTVVDATGQAVRLLRAGAVRWEAVVAALA